MKTALRRLTLHLALWITGTGCVEPPEQAAQRAVRAAARFELSSSVSPDYSDPLGGRAQLAADLRAWSVRYTKLELELGPEPRTQWGDTRRSATVELPYTGSWHGDEPWLIEGVAHIDVTLGWATRARSGVFVAARDLMALFDGIRKAGSPSAAMTFIHPNYSDGVDRFDDLEARWEEGQIHPFGVPYHEAARVRLQQARASVGEDWTDLALHLRLPGPTGPRPSTLRIQLRPSAGRLLISRGLRPPILD